MNVVLVEREELASDGSIQLSGPRAEHIRVVLGLGPGALLRIGIIDGPLGTAEVTRVEGESVWLRADDLARDPPPRARIDLLLAVPRPKVLKRLWSPLAQLGVGRVMLTAAARVEKFYFDSQAITPEISRARMLEGLAQVRDTRLPIVTVHRSLERLVTREVDALSADAHRFVADVATTPPAATPLAPLRVACALLPRDARAVIAIGPEGGWLDEERALLAANRFTPVTLGARSLRSDVACIAILTLAHEALGRG